MREIAIENNTFKDMRLEFNTEPNEKVSIIGNLIETNTLLQGITIEAEGSGRIDGETWHILTSTARALAETLNLKVTLANFNVDGLI